MASDPSILFPETSVGLKSVSARNGEQVSFLEGNGRYEYEVLSAAQIGHRSLPDFSVFPPRLP